jgi:hypothetical protein
MIYFRERPRMLLGRAHSPQDPKEDARKAKGMPRSAPRQKKEIAAAEERIKRLKRRLKREW